MANSPVIKRLDNIETKMVLLEIALARLTGVIESLTKLVADNQARIASQKKSIDEIRGL